MRKPMTDPLIAAAMAVRKRAYAPYSRFLVGAAVETTDGRIFAGCNVENASYGLAICAEQVAIARAVAEGARQFRRIAIVANLRRDPCPPCGACRQFLHEFNPRIDIIMVNTQGARRSARLDKMFPTGFDLLLHRHRRKNK